jgi:hypothetical protein
VNEGIKKGKIKGRGVMPRPFATDAYHYYSCTLT